MTTSLWREHVLPFSIILGFLAAITLASDYFLHLLNLVCVDERLKMTR